MAFNLKAVLEAEVIDRLIAVMAAEDKKLAQQIAGLGTRVGAAPTYAELPTVDQNGKAVTAGDTATLTKTDGEHPSGLYEFDGTKYVLTLDYDALDIASIIENAKAEDGDTTSTDKFVTPAQVEAVRAAEEERADSAYHVKGGSTSEKLIAPLAEEDTDSVVVARQLSVTFTQEEVQAKYDAL